MQLNTLDGCLKTKGRCNAGKTLFKPSERTFSKTPNGRATDVGIWTHNGTFPFRYEIFRDLAPT